MKFVVIFYSGKPLEGFEEAFDMAWLTFKKHSLAVCVENGKRKAKCKSLPESREEIMMLDQGWWKEVLKPPPHI